jgi:hypothetical protein
LISSAEGHDLHVDFTPEGAATAVLLEDPHSDIRTLRVPAERAHDLEGFFAAAFQDPGAAAHLEAMLEGLRGSQTGDLTVYYPRKYRNRLPQKMRLLSIAVKKEGSMTPGCSCSSTPASRWKTCR